MKRRQLVELEDLPWFPAILRDGGTSFLELAERGSGHGRALAGPLARALERTGERRLFDLCSGGGGPASTIVDELGKRGLEVEVTLSDLYPNRPALERVARASGGAVSVHHEPVDATAVPAHVEGFRTIFNAFHHFPPAAARAVLAAAFHARRPIGVFEVVSRQAPMLLGILLTPLTVTLSMPFWRPFRWPWLVLTWVLPVMQLFVLWDGLVSWLRIYEVDELRELIEGLEAPDWVWEVGTVPLGKLGKGPLRGVYLVGHPRAPGERADG